MNNGVRWHAAHWLIRMLRFTLILLLGLLASPTAFAQTRCPMGAQTGSMQCIPDDLPAGSGRSAPPRPTGEWIKTWGAIAGSNATGESGAVVGKLSEQEAGNAAIRLCAAEGAKDCKVDFSFRNQCAVMVTSTGNWFTQGGPDKQEAIDKALERCEKKGGRDCKAVWSGCSEPIFQKY